MELRFHWSMSSAGNSHRGAAARAQQSGVPDLAAHLAFCKRAEACGIDSLLTAFGFHRPDPIVLAAALGVLTERIKFMVAVRSGVNSPTSVVQQINTISVLTRGRVCLNIVAGHTPEEQQFYGDFLAHDQRYERTDEFLTICRRFWSGESGITFTGRHYAIENGRLNTPFVSDERAAPEIFLGGNSSSAEALAVKHADCLWRLPDTPERLEPRIAPIVETGTEVGLLVSMIARPSRAEAVDAANAMVERLGAAPQQTQRTFARGSDSVAFRSVYELARTTTSGWIGQYLVERGRPVSRCPVYRARRFGRRPGDSHHRLHAGRHHPVPVHGVARHRTDDVLQRGHPPVGEGQAEGGAARVPLRTPGMRSRRIGRSQSGVLDHAALSLAVAAGRRGE